MKNIIMKNMISASVIVIMMAGIFALPILDDDFAVHAVRKKMHDINTTHVAYVANGMKFTEKRYADKSSVVKKVVTGKERGDAPDAEKEGYTLTGWYTQESGGIKVTPATIINKKTVLYAHWRKESH